MGGDGVGRGGPVVALPVDEVRGSVGEALPPHVAVVGACGTALILVVAASPLGHVWFGRVSGLPPALMALAAAGVWFAVPLPGITAFVSLYQGAIVHGRRTRAITESVVVYLGVLGVTLAAGVVAGAWVGLFVGIAASTLGNLAQLAWLWWRARATLDALSRPATAV